MALVVVEVNPLGATVSSDTIGALLKQWNNSNDFDERHKIKKMLTPEYNAQIINLANKGDVYAQKFQRAYISAEAATAAIEPVSTTSSSGSSSHAGSSGSTTSGSSSHTASSSSHAGSSGSTTSGSSSHTGSSSSHTGSSSSHAGARTTTTTTTSTSSTTTDGGTTATPTTEAAAVQVPDNANPYIEPTVSSRTGQTQYYVSSLDPNAGSWTFKLNNGTDYATTNYEEAQLIEAALREVGKGPRNGNYTSWDRNGVTYYTYEEAWAAYEQQLAQTLQRLANNGNTTENGQMNEQALLAAMMQQQNQETTTADDLTEYYDTTPAQTKKKNTWLWWLLGGAVVVSGILVYRSNKKRR